MPIKTPTHRLPALPALKHAPKAKSSRFDQARPSAAKRGYGRSWRKSAALFLANNPLCRTCDSLGQTTPANVVDHVVPHKADMILFWDSSNWQPLCKSCHDRKTAREQIKARQAGRR